MQITTQLAGKVVREVLRNGSMLVIRCEDGFELAVGWADPATGNPVKGEPVVVRAGKHIMVLRGAIRRPGHLIEVPHRRDVGL